ncbi:hypothetical protein [Flavobacterium chungangensis]|uniref:Phage tail tape measure protein n=1 Tax=Flavobacterium chungangensis TaxID=2708132 RepID=A0ABV8ZE93_9FLAO
MIKKTAEIQISTNAQQAENEINNLNSAVDGLTNSTNRQTTANDRTRAAIDDHTKKLKNNSLAVLENGGAVGVLGEVFGPVVMLIKDSIEALELFTVAEDVNTVSTTANTTATVASSTSRQAAVLNVIKDTAAKVGNAIATGALTAVTYVATAAQWLWNTAIMANPLVALVVLITAAVTAIVLFTKHLIDSAEANEKAAEAAKKNTKALQDQSIAAERAKNALQIHNDHQYKMREAAGASSEALRQLAIRHINEEIALNKKSATIARDTFLRERNTLATLKAADASDEVIEAQEKLTQATWKEFQEQNQNLDKSYKERAQIRRDNEVAITKENTAAANKAKDDAKKESEKNANELKAKRKADLEAIRKANEEASIANKLMLQTEKEQELSILKSKYDEQKALFEKYGKDTNEIDIKYLNDKNDINLKYQKLDDDRIKAEKEKADALKKANEDLIKQMMDSYDFTKKFDEAKNLEELNQLKNAALAKLDAQRIADEAKLKAAGATEEQLNNMSTHYKNQAEVIEKEKADTEIDFTKRKYEAVSGLAQKSQDFMSALETAGIAKSKAARNIQKGLVLAQLAADSASAISTAIPMALKAGEESAKVAGPAAAVVGPVVTAASLIGSITMVAKNVAKAKQTLSGGGAGGESGGGSASAGGTTIAAAAPKVEYQNTPQTQLADSINNANATRQNTIKAYVVSSEMTDRQNLDNQINTNAKF